MEASPLSAYKNKIVFAGCWLIWLLVHLAILRYWDIGWLQAIADVLVTNIILGCICILTVHNMRYYKPAKSKYLYLLMLCLTISLLGSISTGFILFKVLHNYPAYYPFIRKSIPVRFDIFFLATGCTGLMSVLWYTRMDQEEQEQRKAHAEKMAKEAELYKLRQQLQPHFLFNSLNSISALVVQQPALARKMIQQLSDFLRGTLKKEENQWTTLGEELLHLQLYLEIEKVRFGHRLHTHISSTDEANEQQIPHMLLQPIAENAIKFGLYDTTGTVTITLNARLEDYYLVLTIQNPFDPGTASPQQGTGFGLSSVQRRLCLLFARHDLLTTQADDELFTTIVKIPQVWSKQLL